MWSIYLDVCMLMVLFILLVVSMDRPELNHVMFMILLIKNGKQQYT